MGRFIIFILVGMMFISGASGANDVASTQAGSIVAQEIISSTYVDIASNNVSIATPDGELYVQVFTDSRTNYSKKFGSVRIKIDGVEIESMNLSAFTSYTPDSFMAHKTVTEGTHYAEIEVKAYSGKKLYLRSWNMTVMFLKTGSYITVFSNETVNPYSMDAGNLTEEINYSVIPSLPQANVTGLVTDLSNLQSNDTAHDSDIAAIQNNETSYVSNITVNPYSMDAGNLTEEINYSVIPSLPQANVTGLVTDLAGKEPTVSSGVPYQFYAWNKTWQNITTTWITEGTNLFYTAERAISALTGINAEQNSSISGLQGNDTTHDSQINSLQGNDSYFNGSVYPNSTDFYNSSYNEHLSSDGSDHSYLDQSVISGATPTFDGANITNMSASYLNFSQIGTPTYYNAQDWFNIVQSAGIMEGCELNNSRNANELDVNLCEGLVKSTDSEIGETAPFTMSETLNVSLTSNSMNYIYVEYNAGSPQVAVTTTRSNIELNREFILGRVYKNGDGTIYVLNAGVHVSNLARTEHERLVAAYGFEHASGAVTSESGTLKLAVTNGSWYLGHNTVPTNALDTNVSDTFVYIHYNTTSGEWITDNATATTIDYVNYSGGTDALASMSVNAYTTQWMYITQNSLLYLAYGTTNGNLAAAEAEDPPSTVPPLIEGMGEIIAKLIIKQTGEITDIGIAHEVVFHTSGTPNHDETGGIDTGDIQHLTATQETDLTDSGESTLHYHNSDRNSANAFGLLDAYNLTNLTVDIANNVTGVLDESNIDSDIARDTEVEALNGVKIKPFVFVVGTTSGLQNMKFTAPYNLTIESVITSVHGTGNGNITYRIEKNTSAGFISGNPVASDGIFTGNISNGRWAKNTSISQTMVTNDTIMINVTTATETGATIELEIYV